MLNHRAAALDGAFRALADPTRRAIIERLSGGGASVSDLAGRLPMSLAGVHQHLQVLAASGLMTWEKRGRVRWCRLEPRRLREVEEWVLARRLAWERRLDGLAAHVERAEHKAGKRRERAKSHP